ncbi:MAG: 50S ribosomal protein L25 [Clostridiaceae bacterium]
MSDRITYEFYRRENENVKRLRNEGKIPGVIYGGKMAGGQSIYVEAKVLSELLKNNTKSSILSIKLGKDKLNAVVKKVQRDPLTAKAIHADFQSVAMDEVLTLTIPVKYINEDEVMFRKLIANINFNEVQVKGEADKIPEEIVIDLQGKTPEDRVTAGDIELPEGIEMITQADELMFIISEPKGTVTTDAEVEEAPAADTTTEN